MSKKISSNGKPKTKVDLSEQEIKYPINFDFKALMDATINDDENKENIIEVFNKNNITYLYHDKKISTKGTYISFTFKITINSKDVMKKFYTDLKVVKGLKFAL